MGHSIEFLQLAYAINPAALEWFLKMLPSLGGVLLELVPSVVTIVAALMAFRAAERQIEKQSQAAFDRWKVAEKQKYKSELYERIIRLDSVATSKSCELAGGLRSSLVYLHSFVKSDLDSNNSTYRPDFSNQKLSENYSLVMDSINELVSELERWEIVDPRMSVFRLAFAISVRELNSYRAKLSEAAMKVLPFDPNDQLPTGYWEPVTKEGLLAYERAADPVLKTHGQLLAWLFDLGVEMQMLTLQAIFDQKLERRDPPDRSQIVISLDNYIEVGHRLRSETVGGREIAEIERSARSRFAGTTES